MEAKEHLQAGRLQEALSTLQQAVRKSPADESLRIFLFELLSLLGEWEKALTQLQIVGEIDPNSFLLSQAFESAIQCEVFRGEVFSGSRTPLIFGEPEPWVSWLVQANHLIATGQAELSRELRERGRCVSEHAYPGTILPAGCRVFGLGGIDTLFRPHAAVAAFPALAGWQHAVGCGRSGFAAFLQ
jgi:protein involved in temperature-dependent protein secretion